MEEVKEKNGENIGPPTSTTWGWTNRNANTCAKFGALESFFLVEVEFLVGRLIYGYNPALPPHFLKENP